MAEHPAGTLYVVAVPLGNPDDITVRALKVLQTVELVACEDTRRTGLLLSGLGIKKTLTSFHSHTTLLKAGRIVEALRKGSAVALLTDCGTPGVSDPGAALVREALDAGIDVVPVPGPSALAAALSVSGFAGSGVYFAGFFSPKAGKRRRQLAEAAACAQVVACYESPHRVRKLLEEVLETLGDREVVLCREMTKTHEEFVRGRAEVLLQLGFTEKGEFTVLINTAKKT